MCGGTSPCQLSWHRKKFFRKVDNKKLKKSIGVPHYKNDVENFVHLCLIQTFGAIFLIEKRNKEKAIKSRVGIINELVKNYEN